MPTDLGLEWVLVTWCLTPCIQCSAKKLIYAQTDTNLDYHKEPNRNPEGEAMWRGINLSLSILSPATLQSLSRDAAKILVQAFISSRLDYCNSVLYVVTDNLLQRLQSVQNAAARLITRTGRREHVSPVVQELHWLLVRRRDDFKLTTLMFKSLHGWAPSYLSDVCKSGAIKCVIPWSRTRLGDRFFDVAGPRLWNKLSASLQSSDSLCQFRRQLKRFLFVRDEAAVPSDYCF